MLNVTSKLSEEHKLLKSKNEKFQEIFQNAKVLNKSSSTVDNQGIANDTNEMSSNETKSLSKGSRVLHQSISIDEKYMKNTKEKYENMKRMQSNTNSSGFLSSITDFFSQKFQFNRNINLSETNRPPCHSPLHDYYNYIKEQNKLLPKEFQIRRFPMSSCENTFENVERDISPSKDDNVSSVNTSIATPPKSPTVVKKNVQINGEIAEIMLSKPLSKTHSISNESKVAINHTLKRYYHVFKANELDKLINESVSDVFIYKSYYDHGNWCVCAQKKF